MVHLIPELGRLRDTRITMSFRSGYSVRPGLTLPHTPRKIKSKDEHWPEGSGQNAPLA